MIRSVSCIRTRLSAGLPGRALETAHRLASTFTATDIEFTKTSNPSSMPPKEELTFGTTFSDHMLEIDWSAEGGWEKPKISAYSTLAISPAASGLHYGLQCFEGMKAYRAKSDPSKISLFRPDCNMQRMNDSMARLQMPSFDGDALIDCMRELIRIDEKWVPEGDGYSLYIRPTAVATHPWLGVGDAQQIKLFVITCPVGPYYPTGFNPVKVRFCADFALLLLFSSCLRKKNPFSRFRLLTALSSQLYADNVNVRAWPGGVGNCKVGGNYATTIKPAKEAMAKGYHQVLWMFGEDDSVTECGAMNLFFFWVNKDTGRKEVRRTA